VVEDVQRVSPEVLAVLLGVIGGVVIERVARSWGRLWCEPSAWEISLHSGDDWEGVKTEVHSRAAQWATYNFRLDLFNGKEIPMGFRDISLVFRCLGGEIRSVPKDKSTEKILDRGLSPTIFEARSYEHAYVVNLPPRQWVVKELFGRFDEPENITLLARWYRVEFVGERQRRGPLTPKTFRKTIASRPPFSDPWAH
jgi:hypothetical protein